jgi:hypothetical protein
VTHNKRIELRETEIEVLIRRGLLKADARNDVFAVRDALYRHFEATLKAWTWRATGLHPLASLRTRFARFELLSTSV